MGNSKAILGKYIPVRLWQRFRNVEDRLRKSQFIFFVRFKVYTMFAK